jgi:hypothetical protein
MIVRIAFYDPYNPKQRKDGGEFTVCAKEWAGQTKAWRARDTAYVRASLEQYQVYKVVFDQIGFFCHGFPNKLSVWAPTADAEKNAGFLAAAIRPVLVPGGAVPLYACRTESDPTKLEFAELLSRELPGSPVLFHYTSGHTTENPYVGLMVDGKVIFRYPDIQKSAWKRYVTMAWQALCTEQGWKDAELALGIKLGAE